MIMQKPDKWYDIQHTLRMSGYTKVSNNEAYIWAVLEYIEMCGKDYTISQWLKDTEENYPEDLREGDDI